MERFLKNLSNVVKAQVGKRVLKWLPPQKKTECFNVRTQDENLEDVFETSDGRKIPVWRNHRYSLKKCWAVFGPMAALAELNNRNLLALDDQAFLKHAIGYRTVTEPFYVIRARLRPYLEKFDDLFVTTDIPDIGKRLLIPFKEKTEALISLKASQHRILMNKIGKLGPQAPKEGDDVLEIGYTSGGETIIAFERLGFKAHGIDNFYYDAVKSTSRHDVIREQTGTKVNFVVGDITTKTVFSENSLSFIYSLSVLEHVADLPAAFREMYRILKPGGFMMHRYDPFFHIGGAHSHASLDSPWAHMRMDDADLERYLRKYRPNEANVSLPWIRNALNRRHHLNFVQSEVAKAGFNVRLWELEPIAERHRQQLSSEILRNIMAINQGVTIADLTHLASSFIAQKPLD